MVTPRRVILVAIGIALLTLPAVASAHAVLISSSPAVGSIVAKAPDKVTITFNENISAVGASVQVIGPDGKRYDRGAPAVAGHVVTEQVATGLPQGTSTVAWSVISDDGHRVTSAFLFSVGRESIGGGSTADAAKAASAGLARPSSASTVMAISRALRFAGIVLLLGLLAVVALVWDPTMRRGREEDPVTAAAADGAFRPLAVLLARLVPPVLAAIAVVGIPVEAWAVGISLRGELDLRQGRIALAQAVLALIAWPLLVRVARGDRRLQLAAAVPVILLAITPGLAGHANAQATPWISIAIDWIHVLAAGAWGGGVLVLAATAPAVFRATTAESRGPLLRGIIRRFTRIALIALTALVVSGAIAAVILTGSITDLWQTSWGRILIAKVAVVLAAVLIAGIVRRGDRGFSRAVQLEALLIIVAIALTGTLTGLAPQPPRAAAATETAAGPFHLERKIDARDAQVDITPGRARTANEVHVIVTNGVGQPALDVKDATVELAHDSETRLPVQLTPVGTAHWSGTVRIPSPGRWTIVVRLRIGEFREETLHGVLTAS